MRRDWPATSTDSPREHLADAAVHAVGVVLGLLGCAVLLRLLTDGADPREGASLVVYGLGLLAMLGTSALYNMAPAGPGKAVLRRIDHAAIFVMIAATYTPFAVLAIGGVWGAGLLAFVWVVAAAGVVLKLTRPEGSRVLSVVMYLLLGWCGLLVLEPMLETVATPVLVLLGAGGLVYSIGALIHLAERLPYHRAIWHLLVLAGAACHYVAVLRIAGPATT